MVKSITKEKSLQFAILISKFSIKLKQERLYDIASQLFRSGTSIGANIMESQGAQSKKDFISKLEIALKEAYETNYWLDILRHGFDKNIVSLKLQCNELVKLLVSSIKTIKSRL